MELWTAAPLNALDVHALQQQVNQRKVVFVSIRKESAHVRDWNIQDVRHAVQLCWHGRGVGA
jgi:hypothetical protein